MPRPVLALLIALTGFTLAGPAGALRLVGTPLGLPAALPAGVTFRELPAKAALKELYAGRADVALLSVPGGPPPAGTGPVAYVPIGVFAARVVYQLPGVRLRLDVGSACRLFAGQITLWNDPALAALNPGEALPALPVLSSARAVPAGANLAFSNACVSGGWWPARWRKSSWAAGAVNVRESRARQLADLTLTGSVAVLGPLDAAPETQSAPIENGRGAFVEAAPGAADLTAALPVSPDSPLPPGGAAYPFRGLVWAAVLREQRYRGRGLADARAVAPLLRALQIRPGRDLAPLPPAARAPVKLTYAGKRLDGPKLGPPAP